MLPIFSATFIAALTANDLTTTEFPAEFPTDKELADWLDVILPSLRAQYGAVMRGNALRIVSGGGVNIDMPFSFPT